MYAAFIKFVVKPGMKDEMEKVADMIAPILRDLKGFKTAMYLSDSEAGEYFPFRL